MENVQTRSIPTTGAIMGTLIGAAFCGWGLAALFSPLAATLGGFVGLALTVGQHKANRITPFAGVAYLVGMVLGLVIR